MSTGAPLIELEELGPTRLAGVAERLATPEVAFAALMRDFEAEERSIFASYAGKYVQTGALMASLTGSGSGAIRELTPGGLAFGTSVWYGVFQGTTGDGDHRPPSAIMKMPESVRAGASKLLMEYVLHGGRA